MERGTNNSTCYNCKVNPKFAEEINQLVTKFEKLGFYISSEYFIFDKIGEGTFSSVYKAIDLKNNFYDNAYWELPHLSDSSEDNCEDSLIAKNKPEKKRRVSARRSSSKNNVQQITIQQSSKLRCVAIKKIYVTSSCIRIQNELELLNTLNGSAYVTPIVTASRCEDQIIVVLPFFKHDDFKDYFQKLIFSQIQQYFFCLFKALKHCHDHMIIHRDVKPSNFLYRVKHGHGVLADFGLAHKQNMAPILENQEAETILESSTLDNNNASYQNLKYTYEITDSKGRFGIIKNDSRPSIKANRAGTRGFRAPEVLFKVINQTTAIDIWSAGVILLCFLARRFPFFNSNNDHEALLEIALIFGKEEMTKLSKLLNRSFKTNIPSITEKRTPLRKLCRVLNPETYNLIPSCAFDLLEKCLTLNPLERITAQEALNHPFLTTKIDE